VAGRLIGSTRSRKGKSMEFNETLLRRLIETPGVSGREEQQREIAREELGALTDEVRTDVMGSVIGTKRGSADTSVMIAAHTDEIGFLVKYIDDKGFLRLQTLGGHDPANMVSQRVIVTTSDGTALRGALQPARKPPHLQQDGDQKPPKTDEFYVDLGMPADEVNKKRFASEITRRWTGRSKRWAATTSARRWTTASGCS
jgi:endoglucanase